MAREQWSSRLAFIVAAIGSAIGFGNVWRFPTLAYEFGGGAFFIPYLLALFIIGIPILILEISIGQYYQTGDAGSFGQVNKRFRGLGLGSVMCSFAVTTYYCVLLAWVLRMFIFSFMGSEGRWKGVDGSEAYDWFVGTLVGQDTAGGPNGLTPTRLVGANVAALSVTWVLVYLAIAFGVKWTGRITYVTVGLPILFLFVLLIRAVTLPGSGAGVKAYIGEWDLSILSQKPEVWSQAATQVFFSIGVTFGIMTAYSSYNKRNSPVFSNSLIIAISNSMYSIIAGFAVFGTIGYLAYLEGKPISELSGLGGPALMFGTYPVALSTLPASEHWERLLFVVLFLLGIDSAFAFTEAVVTVFQDTKLLYKVPRYLVTAGVCFLGFLGGLIFCTDTGLIFLDVVDYYVNFMMLLVGFLECLAVGWAYGVDAQVAKLGLMPVLMYWMATFVSVSLASVFWFGTETGALWKGFVAFIVSYGFYMALVFFFLARTKKNAPPEATWMILLKELFMGNVLHLRGELQGVVNYIPLIWFFLIRHVIPPALLILFANLAASENEDGKTNFGHYAGLPVGYQALGIFIFVLTLVVIVLGGLFPWLYSCFSVSPTADEEEMEYTEVETKQLEREQQAETEQVYTA